MFQQQKVGSIYQSQSNPVFDEAIRKGRTRFGQGQIVPRSDTALPLLGAIRHGFAFFDLPDMDFGTKDAPAFVPFMRF